MNFKIVNIGILLILINTLHISSAVDCDDIGEPTGFDVTVVSGKLIMIWDTPSNLKDCDIHYNLVLDINGRDPLIIDSDKSFYVYDYLDICYKVIATLTLVTSDENRGPPAVKEVSQEIGDVELSLTVVSNKGILLWDKPKNSDICDIRYDLRLEIDGEETHIDLEKEFYVLDNVKTCSVLKASLVAIASSGVRSRESTTEESTGLPQIANLKLEDLTLSWDVLTKYSESCKYEIKINQFIASAEGTSYNLLEEHISGTPCTSNDIEVTPVSDIERGQSVSTAFDVLPKELDSFEIEEEEDFIKISWLDDFGNCKPEFNIEEAGEEFKYGDGYATIQKSGLKPCKTYEVIGQVKYNNVGIGTPLPKSFTKNPEKIEDFEVVFISTMIIATWSDKFENCKIEIVIDNQTPIETDDRVSFILNPDYFSLCITHEIKATAMVNTDNRGESTSVSFKKSINWKEDTFNVIESENSIVPSWSDNFEHCEIEIIVRYGESGVDFYDHPDLTNNVTPLDKTNYEYCMIYRVLFMVFDDDEFLLDSTEHRYEKIPSTNFDTINQLKITLNTIDNYVTANWEIQDLKECSLNYFGGCAVDVDLSNQLSEIIITSDNDIYTYEFSNCKITTETENFAMAIQPKYNEIDGEVITCIYSIEYTVAENEFSFIRDNSTNIKCPSTDSYTETLLKRNNPILSLLTNFL